MADYGSLVCKGRCLELGGAAHTVPAGLWGTCAHMSGWPACLCAQSPTRGYHDIPTDVQPFKQPFEGLSPEERETDQSSAQVPMPVMGNYRVLLWVIIGSCDAPHVWSCDADRSTAVPT